MYVQSACCDPSYLHVQLVSSSLLLCCPGTKIGCTLCNQAEIAHIRMCCAMLCFNAEALSEKLTLYHMCCAILH